LIQILKRETPDQSEESEYRHRGYMSFPQEELDEFVDKANLPLELEEMIASDGTYIKDFLEAHPTSSLTSLAQDEASRSASSRGASAEDIKRLLIGITLTKVR
jgi:hypothetical protein